MDEDQSASVFIQLMPEDLDEEELLDVSQSLQEQIRELHVDEVQQATLGPAQEGTKSAELIAAGGIVVSLAPYVIPGLVDLLKSWTARRPTIPTRLKVSNGKKHVEVEFDPGSITSTEVSELVKKLEQTIS